MASKLLVSLLGLDAETVEAQASAHAVKDLSEVKVASARQEMQAKRVDKVIEFCHTMGIEIYKVDASGKKTFDKQAWKDACESYDLATGKTD